jgi:hypothetical protein
LTDVIGIGVLTRLINRDLVDEVLDATGKRERRERLLPARVVVYYTLALTLFYGDSYEEVMRRLVSGLSGLRAWRTDWRVPTTGAISQARVRLGSEPLRELFARVARPIAGPGSAVAWYRSWRVMAVDGVLLDMPDTPENVEKFPKGRNHLDERPFPQCRVVGLAECGSRALVDAAIGTLQDDERSLMNELAPSLSRDMLLLADRGFFGYDHWKRTRATGAELLWRVSRTLELPVLEVLPDGSYRSELLPKEIKGDLKLGKDRVVPDGARIPVRVVEYRIPDRPGGAESIRLVTSLLDHEHAPALELAALYHERWEFELALDEIETHQLGRPRVLRSKLPDLVRQEVWALLLTHYAVRQLIWEASDDIEHDQDRDPDRISFMRALRVVRRSTSEQAGFSPLDIEPGT